MRLDVTLARIRAIVGEQCVGSPVLRDTHAPDAFRMEPFQVGTTGAQSDRMRAPSANMTVLRQLRPPESIAITLRAHRPVSFLLPEQALCGATGLWPMALERRLVESRRHGASISGTWWRAPVKGAQLCCCVVQDRAQGMWQMVAVYD